MDAVEKSKRRKAKNIARKKGKGQVTQGVPRGIGMGWPENKDGTEPKDDYPTHDGKRWAIV